MTLLNRLDRSLLQMLPLLEHSADALERGLGEAAAQEAAQLRALSDLLCEILGNDGAGGSRCSSRPDSGERRQFHQSHWW